jgi:hypothetical protein
MASRWRRWAPPLVGWFVGPNLVLGGLTGAAVLILGVLNGLPAAVVVLIALAVLTCVVVLAHYAVVLWGHANKRVPPPELKIEVSTIQRELIRLSNRREINGGSIWPIERPYKDLPTEQWMRHGPRLRLKDSDHKAVSDAYEQALRFNYEMLAGETIIASSPQQEPDLDGLRDAFDKAGVALGLPRTPRVGTPQRKDTGRQFGRRNDLVDLAKECHQLAGQIERWAKNFKDQESATAEKMMQEMVGAEPTLDPAEARRNAYSLNEKNWELEYALRFGTEARDLFQRAWEAGEIASEHEQLATRPLAIQFEEVPKLFDEIAESLYQDAA